MTRRTASTSFRRANPASPAIAEASRATPAWRRLAPLDRRILALALPALGALLVEPLYNLADSAIVGHLGVAPLGGLAVATAALNLLGWTAGFLEMATVSAIARARGAGEEDVAARAAGAAYGTSAVLGLAIALLLELIAPQLTTVLGGHASGAVHHDAVVYLRLAAVGLPLLLVGLAGNAHLTGSADTRTPLRIALVANVVNIALEVLLVDGVHLGMAGSALGTVWAQAIAAALFVRASRRAAIGVRRPRRADVRTLVAAGIPLTIRTVALGGVLLATTAIAGRLGAAALGGHQIAFQLWNLLALALDALAVPAQVFVGEAFGVGDRAAARAFGRRTLRLGIGAGTLLGLVTLALSWALPGAFSPSPAVQHEATRALVLCGLQQPLAGAAFVLDGLLLGAGEYAALRRAMILAIGAFAPFGVLAVVARGIGLAGVWVGLLVWLGARSTLLGLRWHRVSAQHS